MDDRVDALYALPIGEFIAARDALVKEMRAAGDKEGTAEVKALRRPTAAAAVVNRLVREHAAEVEQLVSLGNSLRAAQQRALRGDDVEELRSLGRQRTEMVRALASHAPSAQREEVATTLDAAVTSAEAAAQVQEGRLTAPITETGFGDLGELTLVPDGSDAPGGHDDAFRKRRADRDEREAREAAEREVREATYALEAAQEEAGRLEGRLQAARRKVDAARAALTEAEARLRS
ncbi:MAG TPA: hypothetical protein VM030_07540 [Acidimicrobiales bacterium]|nr:hypothetical protein [Acidimicrobiales bacterium]